jgi:hypothetical protein
MNSRRKFFASRSPVSALGTVIVSAAVLWVPTLRAQKAELQERVGDLKESMAKNKEALSHYTWEETVTIYLKSEEKKQERFQVRNGPDGKPQKTQIDAPSSQSSAAGGGKHGGRLKEHVVEKKKEQFEEDAQRMKSLMSRYLPPDKDLIQDAYSKGNISITPDAAGANLTKLTIKDYVKPGDSLNLTFDKTQKQLTGIGVSTYLDSPSDAINLAVTFGKLADGTNHVSATSFESTSRKLMVKTLNSDYSKL